MRVRMTFEFDDQQRQALARNRGRRRPATRTQAVQWLAETVERAIQEELKSLPRWQTNSDPAQTQMPFARPRPGPQESKGVSK